MTGLALHPLGLAHVGIAAALHGECFPDEPWSAGSLAGSLAMPTAFGWLALLGNGSPVGFILGYGSGDDAEIATLCVRPSERRRGVGRALVARAGEAARAAGAARLVLEVAADNAPAQALYRGMGFRPIGTRPSYYRRAGRGVDAFALALELASRDAHKDVTEP